MSLDNLQFPGILVAELYKNNLVSIIENDNVVPVAPGVPKPATEKNESIEYLGEHLKKTSILVHYPNDLYIAESQLAFLANVLKACNLNLADIAIINLARQQVLFPAIRMQLNPEIIICFGTDPGAAGLPQIPDFTITRHENLTLLKAPILEAFSMNNEESKLLKTKLWFCLKELFKVS